MRTLPVLTFYLEMKNRPSMEQWDLPAGFSVERARDISLNEYRDLYSEVGGPYGWFDRLLMDDGELERILGDDSTEVFLFKVNGEIAGYFELDRSDPEDVEIVFLGLKGPFKGKGTGKKILSYCLKKAWNGKTKRVWLHTCEWDDPRALPLYRSFGFKKFDEKKIDQKVPDDFDPSFLDQPRYEKPLYPPMNKILDDIKIREHLEPGDSGYLIHIQSKYYYKEFGYGTGFEAYISRLFSDFIHRNDERERFWIMEYDEKIVGSVAIFKEDEETARLRLLFVHPDFRARGLGERLVGMAVDFAEGSGYGSIVLMTEDILEKAVGIYEKFGFRIIEREKKNMWGIECELRTYEKKITK